MVMINLNSLALKALIVVGLVIGAGLVGYSTGKDLERAECNNRIQETIDDSLRIKRRQDNVPRPSNNGYIERLRSYTI